VLAAVLLLAPIMGYLPMASLAALLMLVAWNMSEVKHVMHTLRVAPKSDVAVLMTCYGLTVAFDMVLGVSVGMMLAALLFMRRMAEVTQTRLTVGDHPELPGPVPAGVAVYEISGPLFFGAAQKAMAVLDIGGTRFRAAILLMDEVQAMDATGLVALESALDGLRNAKCLAILSSVRPQPMALMKKAHLDRRDGVVLCTDGEAALAAASQHIATTPQSTGASGRPASISLRVSPKQ
jgi:SulP family sulfate permease